MSPQPRQLSRARFFCRLQFAAFYGLGHYSHTPGLALLFYGTLYSYLLHEM